MYLKKIAVIFSVSVVSLSLANEVLSHSHMRANSLSSSSDRGLEVPSSSIAQNTEAKQDSLEVKEIEIEGNTVFENSELEKIFASIEGKIITVEHLLKVKDRIKQYYLDRGYIGSDAFLPRQKLTDGRITIRVIEGSLGAIEIEGLSTLSEKYIKARLPKLERPFKVKDLIQALRRLEEDPLIEEITGELKLLQPGSILLSIKAREAKPISTQLRFTNAFSPTIGNLGGELILEHQNFAGFGDRFTADYTFTEGLDRYGVNYSIPFNATGGRIAFDYNNADSELIEEVISALDIQADYESFKLSIQQPIVNNNTDKLVFSLGWEKLRSETFVAENVSFPFVDGLEDGVSRITPLRLGQEYTRRGNNNLLFLKSQFNVGLDLFNATNNTNTGIDASFWSWLGAFQWIRAFDEEGNWQFRTSLTTQFTPDKLLPLEQLTVGGSGSVRGYRQNLIVGDNGLVAVVEGQLPLVKSRKWGSLYLVPFADFGTIWSNYSDPSNTQTDTLASLGLELNYRLEEWIDTKVFYGIPLSNTEDFGDASAEERWGFSILVVPVRF